MELTQEDKIRVFGLCMGAQVIASDGTIGTLCQVSKQFIRFDTDGERKDCAYVYNHVQLILKPLEMISDDHAIKLLELACYHPQIDSDFKNIICDLDVERVIRMQECIKIKHTLICFDGYFVIGTVDNMACHFEMRDENEESPEPIWQSHRLIDQLRQWGYHIPYKGHDLFASGIAIKPADKNEII